MSDPHVMADHHLLHHALVAKSLIELLAEEIFVGPVGDLVLAHPLQRVVERIDANIRRNGAELADRCINDFGMPLDIGVVAEFGVLERDSLGQHSEPTEFRVAQLGARMDDRFTITRCFRRMPLRMALCHGEAR